MSTVQLRGLEAARNNMVRARKEFERAKLLDTAYRGVHYQVQHAPQNYHGQFTYRGSTYTK